MHPRAHQQFAWRGDPLIGAHHAFRKDVAPTTNEKCGHPDALCLNGFTLPELVIGRMILPRKDVWWRAMLEPCFPQLIPAPLRVLIHRWHEVHGDHKRAPGTKCPQAVEATSRIEKVLVDIE